MRQNIASHRTTADNNLAGRFARGLLRNTRLPARQRWLSFRRNSTSAWVCSRSSRTCAVAQGAMTRRRRRRRDSSRSINCWLRAGILCPFLRNRISMVAALQIVRENQGERRERWASARKKDAAHANPSRVSRKVVVGSVRCEAKIAFSQILLW